MAYEDAPKNPWLVMVYLAGDNNLTEEMVLALQDLLAEGPPPGDKIVAQLDPSGVGLSTQRYDFSTIAPGKKLEDYLDPDYAAEETNTGSPEALIHFVTWAVDRHGAADMRFLLILCGHGSGTTEDFLMSDESATDALSIDELELALRDAKAAIRKKTGVPEKNIDILGMDACFMSMGEVAYQIRQHVDILIGAEGPEPAFGWPYRRILAAAKAHRKAHPGVAMTPLELARAVVHQYIEHYADYDRAAGRSTDLAAMRLSKIEEVATAVAEISQIFKGFDKQEHEKLLLAHWYAQTYKFDQFVDVYDLCEQMKPLFKESRPDVCSACHEVAKTVEDCVVVSGCSGFAHQHSRGLSIYFPWALVSPDYQDLDFAKATGWHEFLREHVKQTRRGSRFGTPGPPAPEPKDRMNALKKLHMRRLLRGCQVPEDVRKKIERDLDRAAQKVRDTDIPSEDRPRELDRRFLHRSGFSVRKSRYTGNGSKYTGNGSKYTGDGSKYTGDGSRSPADREKSMKNLPPVIGKAYWP